MVSSDVGFDSKIDTEAVIQTDFVKNLQTFMLLNN